MNSASDPAPASSSLSDWVEAFGAALSAADIDAVTALFGAETYWRDLLAFTWNIKTMEGRDAIASMLRSTLAATAPTGWTVAGEPPADGTAQEGWIQFETALGRATGYIRLRDGLCWTLLTALQELKGFEEAVGHRRPNGAPPTLRQGQLNWLEKRSRDADELGVTRQPYALIVGGGQGGLGLGARLKMLGVPTLIVDRLPDVGDQWRSRYNSLCLHDPVWYDHMPYMPFPEHWPVFTPKDKMADWLELYAKAMELDIWTSTECVGASYDEEIGEWQVKVVRGGEEILLRPRQLVFAMGVSGKPNIPNFPGHGDFQGRQLHSSQYLGGKDFAGDRVAVVGSNNSAHDICADLWENGAHPVMIQRSPTVVIRSETITRQLLAPLYSQEAVGGGMTTEKADLIMASIPYRLLPETQQPLMKDVMRLDADFYKRLDDVGFMYDFGEDDTGIYARYSRSASGYYIDVGASDLIASGNIELRSRVGVDRIKQDGIVLSDGSELEADAIIYATGFGSMDEWARMLLPPQSAVKIGPCWGYGSGTAGDPGPWVGELRNMWKPIAQKGLWFHGGNLQSGRHFSRYLALQIKARMEHLPIRVYDTE